jgi:methylated-DNA-protein-cysteine methyltransferase-like protein
MSEPRPKRDFYVDVLETVREIPRGRVTSYGAVAKYLGAARSSRMVGWALNGASEQVPAHRVVNRLGELTGRSAFSTPDLMEERLESEGVRVKNHRIVDFARYFWDPCVEMEIDFS